MGLLGLAMKLLLIFALLGFAVAAQADYAKIQFAAFKDKYGKHYRSRVEHDLRFNIFKAYLAKMEEHNKSGSTWKMAVNQFSDLNQAERKSHWTTQGYKRVPMSGVEGPSQTVVKQTHELPESIDWRDKGAVSPVKNQGPCGSCWAFGTTEQVESYAAIETGSLPILSAQQVTSCAPNDLQCGGTGGCMGSVPQLGFTYLQLFGHVTEESYPYTATAGVCEYDFENTAPVVGITGYNTLPTNNQDAFMTHLAENGPLVVAVWVNSAFQSYGGGVFDGCSYDADMEINHAVQVVGYGSDADGDYWIVRNSWGVGWGEDGYIRMKRDSEAQCGTDSSPMMGTACVGGPGNDEQHVCGQCGILFDGSYPLGAHDFAMP